MQMHFFFFNESSMPEKNWTNKTFKKLSDMRHILGLVKIV